jgi:2-polyprenyl-3-methyl-5-hydroxy-6-metoxy-1,4-benzoquinol methylase
MNPQNERDRVRSEVYESLLRLKLVHPESLTVLSERTRDMEGLKVFRDTGSGVIFIDDHYVGDDEYRSGEFRDIPKPGMTAAGRDLEDVWDTSRRVASFKRYLAGRSICDFGCGAGSFLQEARLAAKCVTGVELQEKYRAQLNADGIRCVATIEEVPQEVDCYFLFHSFEHLPNPIEVLRKIKERLKNRGAGQVVIEVPHARDFLLTTLAVEEFRDFTLWSQHLILHTRTSLEAFMRDAGFRDVVVSGVQRYSLSNHVHWLKHGKPGGHKSNLAILETDQLAAAYADALSRIDASDTLVAIGTV